MANPVETEVEQRLNALMASYSGTLELQKDFKQLVFSMHVAGVEPERIAYAMAQHATAAIAAMKITRIIRPELADALAEDFLETVKVRSTPGMTIKL